jgi:hypothetical protein
VTGCLALVALTGTCLLTAGWCLCCVPDSHNIGTGTVLGFFIGSRSGLVSQTICYLGPVLFLWVMGKPFCINRDPVWQWLTLIRTLCVSVCAVRAQLYCPLTKLVSGGASVQRHWYSFGFVLGLRSGLVSQTVCYLG